MKLWTKVKLIVIITLGMPIPVYGIKGALRKISPNLFVRFSLNSVYNFLIGSRVCPVNLAHFLLL